MPYREGASADDRAKAQLRRLIDEVARLTRLSAFIPATPLVSGRVRGSDGVILGGTGNFTVVRNSAGNYTVTFTTDFLNVPALVVSSGWNAATLQGEIAYFNPSVSGFSVSNINHVFAAADPVEFSFHASDPGA